MGNWVFLLLLYILFGWMKKKQQVKARKEIQDQEDWDKDTTPVSGFGVLDEFLKGQGLIDKDQRPGESVPQDENAYLDSRLDLPIDEAIDAGSNDDLDRLDQLETISEEIESFEDLRDPVLAKLMGEIMDDRLGEGDVVSNLAISGLMLNAYIMTGKLEFKEWILKKLNWYAVKRTKNTRLNLILI